jgi:pyruvate-formate lyase
MKFITEINPMNFLTHMALKAMAFAFKHSRTLKRHMKNTDGWINFSVGIQTETKTVAQTIDFKEGHVKVSHGIDDGADVILKLKDDSTLKEISTAPPSEVLNMLLKNRLSIEGNVAYLQLLTFYLSLLSGRRYQKMLEKARRIDIESRKREFCINESGLARDLVERRKDHLRADNSEDRNVIHLEDPYLSAYDLEDFPRLRTLVERLRGSRPELCAERPKLLTQWYRENGFEEANPGRPWQPELRQGLVFEHLMRNKKPVIADSQLLAGSTTSNPVCGVVVYPDAQSTSIWGELNTVDKRLLNPYDITEETRHTLNDIFPFWTERSFHEQVNREYSRPLSLRINERFVAFVCSKALCVSHTVANLKTILEKGTSGIISEIQHRLTDDFLDADSRASLEGMVHTLSGLEAYAGHLASEAVLQAEKTTDHLRASELRYMAEVCDRVPLMPAITLDHAVQSIWTTWIGMHMENTNAGLSPGRLDQLLQPYYLADMEKIGTAKGRNEYIHHAVDLIGCLYLRIADHMPLSPDIGTLLFGTSSPNQVITLGGVTPEGEDGVNDMTYIFLKVTEMLALPDPNVNARINLEKNSDTYIRRLCEVNFTTSATPSLHNDAAVFESLKQHGYPIEHIRDWSATGCVEPTISGRHNGHTGAVLINLVAALEMAMNNGFHPLMQWDLGPKTGTVEDFRTFDDFFDAYAAQLRFLMEQAVDLNNKYAEMHARMRPTPFISSMIDGCIDSGRDFTRGGARYNTTGTANIGLADVTDSLMVIKKLVFKDLKISFKELKDAVDSDFRTAPVVRALVQKKVPLFGSGSPEAVDMANRVASLVHETCASHRNYRDGRYTSGFWSMSQHTAYGNLSGTLPSGRLAGKPFTPGLTPEAHASRNYLDFISDVAKLKPENMDNNMSFNVKLTPSAKDSREKTVSNMAGYVKTYCSLGGMQMQFNMVSSRMLKDAMANPENYRNLIVRISGYNAYFVTLNKQQQLELIERAEYGV